jgi:hypothetical protein
VALQSLKNLGRLTSRRFLELFRHKVGLLGRVISPSQGLYLHRTTQHRKRRVQTSMPWAGFEPTIAATNRPTPTPQTARPLWPAMNIQFLSIILKLGRKEKVAVSRRQSVGRRSKWGISIRHVKWELSKRHSPPVPASKFSFQQLLGNTVTLRHVLYTCPIYRPMVDQFLLSLPIPCLTQERSLCKQRGGEFASSHATWLVDRNLHMLIVYKVYVSFATLRCVIVSL